MDLATTRLKIGNISSVAHVTFWCHKIRILSYVTCFELSVGAERWEMTLNVNSMKTKIYFWILLFDYNYYRLSACLSCFDPFEKSRIRTENRIFEFQKPVFKDF